MTLNILYYFLCLYIIYKYVGETYNDYDRQVWRVTVALLISKAKTNDNQNPTQLYTKKIKSKRKT